MTAVRSPEAGPNPGPAPAHPTADPAHRSDAAPPSPNSTHPAQPVAPEGVSTAVNTGPAQPVATANPTPDPHPAQPTQPVAHEGVSTAVDTGGAQPAGHGGRFRRGRAVGVAAVAGALLAGGVARLVEPGGSAGAPTVRITARYSRFEPDRVTVQPGSTVRFVVHNADPIDHEFIIGPPETHDIHERGAPHFHTGVVQGEITVPAGATVETTWTFGPSGSNPVEYGCHLSGHWSYGMHGKALLR